MTEKITNFCFKTGDVKIQFPFDTYPTQRQMMASLVAALEKGQNCLLESPTGTGKTLCLLCSVLAWRAKKEETGLPPPDESKYPCGCNFRIMKTTNEENEISYGYAPYTIEDSDSLSSPIVLRFKKVSPISRKRQPQLHTNRDFQNSPTSTIYRKNFKHETYISSDVEFSSSSYAENEAKQGQSNSNNGGVLDEIREEIDLCMGCKKTFLGYGEFDIPKIFYASRTHSQLTQVVKELKKTVYKNTPMTILSSRKNSCINEEIKDKPNVNRLCLDMQKGYTTPVSSTDDEVNSQDLLAMQASQEDKITPIPSCKYYRSPKDPNLQTEFKKLQVRGAFDIEDLKIEGQSCGSCPYYGGKSIIESAVITFCPYNYILNPTLRHFTGLDKELKNSIVIFDEAHNIENVCREEYSFKGCLTSFNLECKLICIKKSIQALNAARTEERLKPDEKEEINIKLPLLVKYYLIIEKVKNWLETEETKISISKYLSNDEELRGVWDAREIKNCFETSLGFTSSFLTILSEDLRILQENETDEIKNLKKNMKEEKFKIQTHFTRLIQFMKSLKRIMYKITENEDHFAMTLKKKKLTERQKLDLDKLRQNLNPVETGTGKKLEKPTNEFNFVLDLICLNPALAFKAIKDTARTIIVTSGTLSPLSSFESELNTSFEIKKSFGHSVNSDRVFARAVSYLPNYNGVVSFSKANLDRNKVPLVNALGEFIISVCDRVDYGVLVFVKSYPFLNDLFSQWGNNGILKRFEGGNNSRRVYREESGESVSDFKKKMEDFKQRIKSGGNCLLFGVFRGKISEGVDFKDDQARAVISVGIPYTYIADLAVRKKKEYNDKKKNEDKRFLSGSDWYNAQAYRALNQGLGRAIRGKDDWGIILMVDERIGRSSSNISKWVRDCTIFYEPVDKILQGIENFKPKAIERKKNVHEENDMTIHLEESETEDLSEEEF